MLIRLSEKKIWGKLAAGMVTEEGGALYILDRNNDILMEYNEKYQKQLKELREQETVKEISENEITTGNLKDDFYYMEGELENDSNKLVYLVPQEIFLKENRKILQRILEMLLLVIGFTVCTMLYFSKRIAKPLVEVAQTLEKAPNGMAVLEEPRGSFKEMSKFVSCYNQAGKKIEELLEKVERESRLKEKAHYEMLIRRQQGDAALPALADVAGDLVGVIQYAGQQRRHILPGEVALEISRLVGHHRIGNGVGLIECVIGEGEDLIVDLFGRGGVDAVGHAAGDTPLRV